MWLNPKLWFGSFIQDQHRDRQVLCIRTGRKITFCYWLSHSDDFEQQNRVITYCRPQLYIYQSEPENYKTYRKSVQSTKFQCYYAFWQFGLSKSWAIFKSVLCANVWVRVRLALFLHPLSLTATSANCHEQLMCPFTNAPMNTPKHTHTLKGIWVNLREDPWPTSL